MKPECLPWHQQAWAQLRQRHVQDALPHAWLYGGLAGTGKRAFALGVAQSLLCTRPDATGWACGSCPSCGWVTQETHPDLVWACPEESGKDIRIETIRHLREQLSRTTGSHYKIALVHPAERLTLAAANSLLKTLEEPPPRTLLFLISDHPAWLAATLRSRCVQVHLPLPLPALAQPWLAARLPGHSPAQAPLLLQLSGGAPLRALTLAEHPDWLSQRPALWQQLRAVRLGQADPLQAAAAWQALPLTLGLEWLQRGLLDLLRLSLVGPQVPLVNSDIADELIQLRPSVQPVWLATYLGDLQQLGRWLQGNLTPLLLWEELLIAWQHSGRLTAFRQEPTP